VQFDQDFSVLNKLFFTFGLTLEVLSLCWHQNLANKHVLMIGSKKKTYCTKKKLQTSAAMREGPQPTDI